MSGTFVQKGYQSPHLALTENKADLEPLAPPYCDPDLHFDPVFRDVPTGQTESVADEQPAEIRAMLNPFPGWARPDDEFMVDL